MIDPPSSQRRHPAIAAFLSFLFPGLGQAYLGERRLALMLAVPVLVLLLAGALAVAIGGTAALNSAVSAGFLTGLVALDLAIMAWRLFAIGEAGFRSPEPQRAAIPVTANGPSSNGRQPMTAGRLGTMAFVVLLMLLTVGMHAWAGMVVGRVNSTLGSVFSGVGGPPGGAGGNPRPLNRPDYAWDGTERINFLLLGIDSGPGREEALTDTILVVSVDPATRQAVMVSVPRDTGYLPLPDRTVYPDALYPDKINQLSTEASENPALWCPDLPADQAAACGLRSLERTIGLYLGIPIQYYATIDLEGFTHLIDEIGPLRLCLPGKLVDPTYNGPGDTWKDKRVGVVLPAGCTDYGGKHALAFARSRKGHLEMPDGTQVQLDDFKRADRQQQVLLELRREFAKMDLFFDLPDVLQAVGSTVLTDFPRDKAGDLASLLPLITGPDIRRVVLDLPRFVDPPLDPDVNYVLMPRRDDVRAEMRRLFGRGNLEGWYLATRNAGPDA
jgi:polyisoprenyl-teichoic acid--peptidoglycan teichoic acid transferase